MKIENLKTAELVPYARNAKLHSDSQISAIAGSIREFGFCNPVLVDGATPPGIIAGHGRVLAAQKLGMESVPCVRLGHLSETQKRAYILADNRLADLGGGYDLEMLKIELEELGELEVDLDDLEFDADFFGVEEVGGEDSKQNESNRTQEVDVDGFALECKCPRCGMEFDPKNEKA